jgi:peptidoglycan/LPS O-acetylase OafA/YrhL
MINKTVYIGNTSKEHITAVDSLRGLAALSVFVFHVLSLYLPEASIFKPWFFLFAGHEAVILFFVLSGFILSLSNERFPSTYKQYLTRRFFRIYPAYYVSMYIAIILFLLIKPLPLNQYTYWFNTQFSNIRLSGKLFFDVLFLVTNPVSNINGVIWSLVYEVIISVLILPLLWRIKDKKRMILLAVFYVIFFIQRQLIHPYSVILDNSIYFSVFFYMGYLVFYFRNKLMIFNQAKFFPIYILCYSGIYFCFGHGILQKATIRDFVTGFGAVGFLCLTLYNQKVIRFLNNKIINFYGRISYSFYLIHIPIIYAFVYTCGDFLNPVIMVIIIFITTTLISALMYFMVEKKFINLAKQLIET